MTPYGPSALAPEASFLTPFPSEQWEQYVQDVDPRQLGIVDLEAAQQLTARDIIDQVIQRRDESKRARDAYGLDDDWCGRRGRLAEAAGWGWDVGCGYLIVLVEAVQDFDDVYSGGFERFDDFRKG